MNFRFFVYIILTIAFFSCNSSTDKDSSFIFRESAQTVELVEGEMPVLSYQKTTKSPNGEYFINNYIHPLYSLDGEVLTEEFPEDHLHHRGIFWAWHQIFVGDKNVGDGWIMKNISNNVISVKTNLKRNRAQLKTHVLWKSSLFQNNKPIIEENTTITVFKAEETFRVIDFEILLKPLVPDVFIGGSDNEKGYGGFSVRIKCPEDLIFTSEKGPVTPQNLQIKAGPWMDFSATFNHRGKFSGLAILCHPSTPNFVAPWILRQQKSMQNIVFPGQQKIKLSKDNPLILRYRLIVHSGNADTVNLAKLQMEYEEVSFAEN